MNAKSPFAMHMGQTLLKLASDYPTITDVLFEEVQNSIDKNARDVWITVNQKSRTIIVADNGEGISREEFERSLLSVGQSVKARDKFGRFGLGLISPIGKCVQFTFTSTPKRGPDYREWMFVTADLAKQSQIDGIPLNTVHNLRFVARKPAHSAGQTHCVPWRTQVRIDDYTKDRQIGSVDIERLREGILDRFNVKMKKSSVEIHVVIIGEDKKRVEETFHAREFTGVKLNEAVVKRGKDVTIVRLFVARRTTKGRKGRVSVGEIGNDFRLDFGMFVRSLPEGFELNDAAVNALRSGFFEGEILDSGIRLHKSRKSFEANDALALFCTAINGWFENTGKEQYSDIAEQRAQERYQDLGIRSMRFIENLLADPRFEGLSDVIGGTSTREGDEKKAESTPRTTAVSVRPVPLGGGEKPSGPPGTKSEPQWTVTGPHGKLRSRIRGGKGLELSHELMEGSTKLWDYDARIGRLVINVRHPLWQDCEKHSDRTLMRFQEFLIMQALELESYPTDLSAHAKKVFDDFNAMFVFWLVQSDILTGRIPGGPGREKKKGK